ncbi:MAG: SLC13 family permease [Bacteroidales bacterium]
MTAEGVLVLVLIVGMIAILMKDRMRPGITLFTVVVIMLLFGIIDANEALTGFSNRGMITVGLLYLVSEGVSRSGALRRVASMMFPTKKGNIPGMLTKMLVPVAALSAFLNNTPIVIIFAPMFKQWAETLGVPSKKILIPLSFATILGGMCTVIGTTTNLVVDGMMISATGKGLALFEVGKVGLPIAIVGLIYLVFASRYLLPGSPNNTKSKKEAFKEYFYDVTVPKSSRLIGLPIINGSLDVMPDMTIQSIHRQGENLVTEDNTISIESGDQIRLSGTSQGIHRVVATPDLMLNALENCDADFKKRATKQVESVLAPRFPGIGQTLEEFDFYRHYGAIVMAIHRNGHRMTEGLNKIKLQEGDNLVLLTDNSFVDAWGDSSVFYLLAETGEIKQSNSQKKRIFVLILTMFMVLGAAFGDKINLPWGFKVDMLSMAALTVVIMAWSNIFPAKKYTKFISWDILITIACAFAISKGMINSGLAGIIAKYTIGSVYQFGPHAVLAILFLITCMFTEIITNNAAAALAFPIALEASNQFGVDPLPFFITICIAASASFLTPFGYQTNLIIQGIGNYRFNDFIKCGLPLSIITFIITVILVPIIWPF